jgi:transposase, IS30 family
MGYGVAMRTRSYIHMSAEERETLSLGLACGHSLQTMATVLGRAPSTLSRESAATPREATPIEPAQRTPWHRLRPVSRGDCANNWIPGCGSMSGPIWPKAARPSRLPDGSNARIHDDMGKQLSAETIYAGLYVLPRGTLRSELLTDYVRRARHASLGRVGRIDAARSPI